VTTDRNGLLFPSEIERRTLLIGKYSEIAGIPKSNQRIDQGHHPFNPDRVVVLQKDRQHWFVDERLTPLCQQVRDEVTDDFRKANDQFAAEGLSFDAQVCGDEKIALLVRIADIVADHYVCREAINVWSRRLVWAESLGTTGFKNHINVLSFNGPSAPTISTDNNSIDWWLFLLPGGTAFENLDGLPVHVLVGHACGNSENVRKNPSLFFDVLIPLVRQPPNFFTTWQEFGQCQPGEATQVVNEHFFSILEELGDI
jgi:hypothetical protein